VANGSNRPTASLSNFASNSNWKTNQWNHVAVVYNRNSLKIFLNGVEVVANNSITFTSIPTSTNAARFGNPSSNSSSHTVFNDASYTGYTGSFDDIRIISGALSAQDLAKIIDLSYPGVSSAVTLSAPAAPPAPNGLQAQALSTSQVKLTWNDNSSNEVEFEIWRAS